MGRSPPREARRRRPRTDERSELRRLDVTGDPWRTARPLSPGRAPRVRAMSPAAA